MIKYAVQVFIDKNRQTTEVWGFKNKLHAEGSFKWKQIKGWDGKSPLYAASNPSNAYLTIEFDKAKLFPMLEGAESYVSYILGHGYCSIAKDYPIIGAQILKVDLRPIIISRTEVNKESIGKYEPQYGHR